MTHFDLTLQFSCFPRELSIILAVSVNDFAFKRPKPKRWLYWIPAAFRYQPELFSKPSDEDVWATKCCKSRQVRFGLKEMVFCYQNCSDLLWEKIVLVIEKKIWGWRPRTCKFFEITRTIYSNSERSEIFLITECFFSCSRRFIISTLDSRINVGQRK